MRDAPRRSIVAAPLLAIALLGGCADPDTGSSRAEVVTTGPEPGAEIATTPAAAAPPATTAPTPDGKGDAAREQDRADATPSPAPTPVADAAEPAAEPTVMPPQTLKPKAPTDTVDRAYVREMMLQVAAGSVLAQAVEERGHDAALRRYASKLVDRTFETVGVLTKWGDELGDFLTQAANPEHVPGDLRILRAPKRAMDQTRALLLLEEPVFADLNGPEFDEAAIDAMIEHHESAIAMSSGTVQTAGSTKFRRFAVRYERAQRRELDRLRALRGR